MEIEPSMQQYKFSIEITQNSKGFSTFTVKVRANVFSEVSASVDEAVNKAKAKCFELNETITQGVK